MIDLLGLPAELLLWVLELLSASFYRDDIRRLTVCKQWYPAAHVVFYSDIYLQAESLSRFLLRPSHSTSDDSSKHKWNHLAIELRGFESWDSTYAQGLDDQAIQASLGSWTRNLNSDLTKLATWLQGSRTLRTLRFTAWSEFNPKLPMLPRREYILMDKILGLLSLGRLSVLELDTCGSNFIHQDESQLHSRHQMHICQDIAALLPQPHRLRLRMREICPLVLYTQDSAVPYLRSVIVNLSLSNEPSGITAASYSRRCGSSDRSGSLKLRSDMEGQATRLAEQMTHPATVRVIFHPHNGCFASGWKLQYFEILTRKRATLQPFMPWDGDGKTEYEDSEGSEGSEEEE
ncbi:hypothetical protein MGYG_02206 [Nannizzia gypsea CBS 118893]|uniref:F-box domain-containing protein n=1 Tax=Arthroderma gypseum (strain ATCC MYA-4604 / CBS 118893) TaxID=535722 RepID=E4UQB1_ARTGP|nr:hypothetical protein MGYG_02206 [Nannizzia gypsea CBS 118893]EFQ99192.1 hypothetical protein MGYG_02206 [Nannizzia gypsea CBS 118893]